MFDTFRVTRVLLCNGILSVEVAGAVAGVVGVVAAVVVVVIIVVIIIVL